MLGRPVHRCMGENWLGSMIIVELEHFFLGGRRTVSTEAGEKGTGDIIVRVWLAFPEHSLPFLVAHS